MSAMPHFGGLNSGYGMLERDDRLRFAWSNGEHTLKMYTLSAPRLFNRTCPIYQVRVDTGLPYEYEAKIEHVYLNDEMCPQCNAHMYRGGFKTQQPAVLHCVH